MRIITEEEEWNKVPFTKRECSSIDNFKTLFCNWLDNSVKRGLPKDSKIEYSITDEGKLFFFIHDVILTYTKDNGDMGTNMLMTIEQVEVQEDDE